LINIPEGFTMTISVYSRFAGGLVLTMAPISWAGLGQAQDMEAVWGVWAGRVGNVEITMCAQSDPDRPFRLRRNLHNAGLPNRTSRPGGHRQFARLLLQLEVGDQTRPPFTGQKLIQIADHLLGVLA
jgi:hypothetical protein